MPDDDIQDRMRKDIKHLEEQVVELQRAINDLLEDAGKPAAFVLPP